MTKKFKKLGHMLLLKYYQKQLNYGGFKAIYTINTAVVWGILPMTVLAAMGIGMASMPLGLGISFCLSSLIMREERIKVLHVNSKSKLEESITRIHKVIEEKYP